MTRRRAKLTEQEWCNVFRIRCACKRGDRLSKEDSDLVLRAYREDPDRYSGLDEDVFNATVPLGSNVRWRK